ncbi:uncharacterized protein LOC133291678 [Gastrolobium bilobum]|uniref:uncharacterized protein LOC133291678 n=1 Tax=Gastrolobium bilobum TaxID=150636 RepID=UPI002AAF22BB|nr:uncharacterized protein LOC133291678 [Gastrolobium bilobum]
MVSFHKTLAESPRTEVHAEFEASSKKRKWEEPFAEEFFKDQNMELQLETPFPSDKWRQYLSIQSGQIQFCNTRVNKTTTEDSKRIPEPPSDHMSLNLELNLTCESPRKKQEDRYYINEKHNSDSPVRLSENDDLFIESSKCKKDSDSLIGSPSWLSSEGDYKEMVATVCMRCHMLVMLCKSSPSCPNCKFMHPPDQNPSKFLKRRCSLFC